MFPGEHFSTKRPEREGLGPGTYFIKPSSTAPCFSLGSRFDSDVRSKDHLRPKKKDGPGPGSYDLPGAVKVAKATKETTFGKATRDWSDLPKDMPAPNQYKNIIKFTEANHQFSIPKAVRDDHDRLMRATQNPGQAPGAYNISRELKGGLAKSFLGGAD